MVRTLPLRGESSTRGQSKPKSTESLTLLAPAISSLLSFCCWALLPSFRAEGCRSGESDTEKDTAALCRTRYKTWHRLDCPSHNCHPAFLFLTSFTVLEQE